MPGTPLEAAYRRIVLPAAAAVAVVTLTIFLIVLPCVRNSLESRWRETAREMTQVVWTGLDHFEQLERLGKLTRAEAQIRALDHINSLRYGLELKGYFWINDTTGVLISHPHRPDLVGTGVLKYRQPDGEREVETLVDVVRRNGESYVDYVWQWQDSAEPEQPNLSYVKGFLPWGWMIGTRLSVTDLQAQADPLMRRLTLLSLGIIAFLSLVLFSLVRLGIRSDERWLEAEQALRQGRSGTFQSEKVAKGSTGQSGARSDAFLNPRPVAGPDADPNRVMPSRTMASDLHLLDLLNLDDLQAFQDTFANATGLASIIIDLDGNNITKPSNFNAVCRMVLNSEKGKKRCDLSNSARRAKAENLGEPIFHQCLSCGFVDGSAPITVAGKHVADWLVGQTNAMNVDRQRIAAYAAEIGVDVDEMLEAFDQMPPMSLDRFHRILDLLWAFAKEISALAYKNLLLARDITERIKAEEALRESEELFRTAFRTSPDAINISRMRDGMFVDVNDGFTTITGYSREDCIGRTSVELHIWNDLADRDKLTDALKVDGWVSNLEAKFRFKDGRVRSGLMSARVITLHGEPHILSVTRDIEVWREAEEALRVAEERVRTFIESVDDLVYYQGLDGSTVMLNSACEKVAGYPKEMFEKDPRFWAKVVHPDDLRIARHFWKSNRKGRAFFDLEYRLRTRSGEWKWLYSRLVGVKDASGNYIGYNCIDRDITAIKAVEAELRVSREKFKDLADLLPQTVFELDAESRFTYINQYGSRFIGYTENDLRDGVNLRQLIPPDRWESFERDLNSVLSGRQRGSVESAIVRKDGTIAPVVIYSSPILQDDQISGLRGIVFDLTETKRLQEFAARAQRLETAGRIAGQVAHDFNNLLGPLVAYPDLIADALPEGSKVSRYVKAMQKAAIQMSEINQQLLTLGRRGHYNLEPLNLNELIREALEQHEPWPEAVHVDLQLADDLMAIIGGRAQILRAVANLINNARDAMRDVGELSLRTENYYLIEDAGNVGNIPRGEYVKLTVTDTGCGIPAEVLPKIFDPFFTTKVAGQKHGSGLGLSIVHAVIEDHHGFVDCTTRPGIGTSFYIYFQIARGAVENGESIRIVGGDERILVVDDDEVQRDVARHLLEKLGYRVDVAENGSSALEKLASTRYDLMVLDMIMSDGFDGAETLERALKINPAQKAVIVSGFAESARVKVAVGLGAGEFIRKPLTMKSLAVAVRKELDRKAGVSATV